jgi:hypothetical protein
MKGVTMNDEHEGKKSKKSMPKHWYSVYYEECVLCGQSTTTRTRIYGEKPEDPSKCYQERQYVCGEHFI